MCPGGRDTSEWGYEAEETLQEKAVRVMALLHTGSKVKTPFQLVWHQQSVASSAWNKYIPHHPKDQSKHSRHVQTLFWTAVQSCVWPPSSYFIPSARSPAWCSWHHHSLTLHRQTKIFIPSPLAFHRITKWLRLEETSGSYLVQLTCSSTAPRADCPGICPDGFWISSRKETPQPLWATCTSAQLPSQQKKSVSWWSDRTCSFVLSLCLLPLVLSLGTAEKSLAPSSLCPPFKYVYI